MYDENGRCPMRAWDMDRYEQLQAEAWELDRVGVERDRIARREGSKSDGDANRDEARGMRQEAAEMLAQYWVVPRSKPPITGSDTLP